MLSRTGARDHTPALIPSLQILGNRGPIIFLFQRDSTQLILAQKASTLCFIPNDRWPHMRSCGLWSRLMKTWWPKFCLQYTVPLGKINHCLTSTSVSRLQAAREKTEASIMSPRQHRNPSWGGGWGGTDPLQQESVRINMETDIPTVLESGPECWGSYRVTAPAVRCMSSVTRQEKSHFWPFEDHPLILLVRHELWEDRSNVRFMCAFRSDSDST